MEKDVPLLKTGMKARIRLEAYPDKLFEGRVERMNSALDLATRTIQTEVHIPNSNRMLKPGMFAKLEIILSEKPQALVVPGEAVLEERGARFVFLVKGSQAFRKEVITGIAQEQDLEILDGLKEGDRVIVKGQESTKDGASVRVTGGT